MNDTARTGRNRGGHGVALLLLLVLSSAAPASAQVFVEALRPSTAVLPPGPHLLTRGTGLFPNGSGTISFDVPAGATVRQVLLYWSGRSFSDLDAIKRLTVNGQAIEGEWIGLAAKAQRNLAAAYRKDVTDLVAAGPGTNTVEIAGLTADKPDGASVAVIYDDGSQPATLLVRDGADFGYWGAGSSERDFDKQTFGFEPAQEDREAALHLLVGDSEAGRPERVKIWIGADLVVDEYSYFQGSDGAQRHEAVLHREQLRAVGVERREVPVHRRAVVERHRDAAVGDVVHGAAPVAAVVVYCLPDATGRRLFASRSAACGWRCGHLAAP